MEVMEAIRTRRSIGKVKPDAVEKEKIERIIEAGIWAPNHHRTEPWKFFVLTGEGRRPLGRTLAAIAKEDMADPDAEASREKLKRTEQKPFRAPVVITVAVTPETQDEKVVRTEEFGAVNAAIQNMLLAAHSIGLGTIWRTGKPAYHPKMKACFGLEEKDEVLGFLYLGYPAADPAPPEKRAVEEVTEWITGDEA